MKIVITGTSGFIVSRLLQTAHATYGESVTAFSSHPSEGNHIVYANRTDFSLAPAELALVEDANVLIHAGAFTPKCGTEANQIKSCNSNIAFTEKLLALPLRNLTKIIFLSTLDVYANFDGPISEATLTVPTTLYGMSKLYCERMMNLHALERSIPSKCYALGTYSVQAKKNMPKSFQRPLNTLLQART